MNKIKRLYINLTNKCNRKCPFCFMWSGPDNNQFLSDLSFWKIVEQQNNQATIYEVQLGGGEPTLHTKLLEFVEYLCLQPLVHRIIIDTNGVILDNILPQLANLSKQYQKNITLKISVNYYLIEQDPTYLNKLQNWAKKYPNSDWWTLCLSIRHRVPISLDGEWLKQFQDNNYYNCAHNFHSIEYTGRAKQNKLNNTVLSQDIAPKNCLPIVYACDGSCFDNDFTERMNYEESLSNDR